MLLSVAAVLGDTVNYAIGHYLGPKVFHFPKSRFFNPEHLRKTHAFYEKYGGKTIIIARFVPIVRTFAPFVAGIGAMSYPRFLAYNVVGGVLWVADLPLRRLLLRQPALREEELQPRDHRDRAGLDPAGGRRVLAPPPGGDARRRLARGLTGGGTGARMRAARWNR